MRPPAIGCCIVPGDLGDRIVLFSFQVTGWTVGMFPVGAFCPGPPLAVVVERDGMVGW